MGCAASTGGGDVREETIDTIMALPPRPSSKAASKSGTNGFSSSFKHSPEGGITPTANRSFKIKNQQQAPANRLVRDPETGHLSSGVPPSPENSHSKEAKPIVRPIMRRNRFERQNSGSLSTSLLLRSSPSPLSPFLKFHSQPTNTHVFF